MSEYKEKYLDNKLSNTFLSQVSQESIIDKIKKNKCIFNKNTIDTYLKSLSPGDKKYSDFKIKNLTFIDDNYKEYYGKIDSIYCISLDEIDILKNTSVGYIGLAFKNKSRIVIFSLRFINESNPLNISEFYIGDNPKIYEVEDDFRDNINIICFDWTNPRHIILSNTPFADKLNAAYNYYNDKVVELETNKEKSSISVDVGFLRSYSEVFQDIDVDESHIILPIYAPAPSREIQGVTFTYNNKSSEKTFLDNFDCIISPLSSDDLKDFNDSLKEIGVNLPANCTLCLLDMSDINQSDVFSIKKILFNGNVTNITINRNIAGDKTRYNRILSGIENSLREKVINKQLTSIICNNDITSSINCMKYEPDTEYIEYLKTKYSTLSNNQEQLIAVDKIVQMQDNDVDVLLVQGPPGTGKTEMILALAKELTRKKYNTLITSNVHVACDNVFERLINNKDLVLKRYTAVKGDKYITEKRNNKIAYIKNQVLAGFQHEETVISSDKEINSLLTQVEELQDEKNNLISKIDEYDLELASYRALDEQYNLSINKQKELNEKKSSYDKEIENLNTELKELISQKEKNDKKEKEKNYELNEIDVALEKINKLKTNLRGELSALYDSRAKLQGALDLLNAKYPQLSEKETALKQSIEQLLSAEINYENSRYLFYNQLSKKKLSKYIAQQLEINKADFDCNYKEIVSAKTEEITILSETYKILSNDDEFWNKNDEPSVSSMEYIFFNSKKHPSFFKRLLSEETFEALEKLYKFSNDKNKQPFILKITYRGKKYDTLIQLQSRLNEELKSFKYDFEGIIERIICDSCSDENFLKEASDAKNKLERKQIEARQKGIIVEPLSYFDSFSNMEAEIEKLKQEEAICQSQYNELRAELIKCITEKSEDKSISAEEIISNIDLMNEFTNNLRRLIDDKRLFIENKSKEWDKHNKAAEDKQIDKETLSQALKVVSDRSIEIWNSIGTKNSLLEKKSNALDGLKEALSNLENDIKDKYSKLELMRDELIDLINSYPEKVNQINQSTNAIDKKISKIKTSVEHIKEKTDFLVKNSEWEEEKASALIYDYINEVSSIVEAKENENSETYYRRVDKNLDGIGKEFDNMFSLINAEGGSLISMTTNQIASLLEASATLNFDYVIVDEASKCKLEDLIISLPRAKHLVLIGDYMQLDPMYDAYDKLLPSVHDKFTEREWDELNESSFSMLLTQHIKYNEVNGIDNFDSNPCVAVLNRQYRMNEGIFNVIKPIYSIHPGFELIDAKKTKSNDIMCIQIDGNEISEGTSYANYDELDAIVEFLLDFNERREEEYPNIKTIGIIAPYRSQERYIRHRLRSKKISGLKIGTVDRFQGREFDMVILSLVRTKKLGFTDNIRRMNVAFSRAKNYLLVFGNFSNLEKIAEKTVPKKAALEAEWRENIFVTTKLIPTLDKMKVTSISKADRQEKLLNFIKEAKA